MGDRQRLSITIDLNATPPVVALAGEIDVETARDLRQVLDEFAGGPQDVVFDMSAVEFIDSSGLGLLLSVRRLGALTLRGLSDRAYRLFELTGLHEVFKIERIDAVVLDEEEVEVEAVTDLTVLGATDGSTDGSSTSSTTTAEGAEDSTRR